MFPVMSDMPMFEKRFNNLNARFISDNAITLPSSPSITSSDITRVYKEIMYFLNLS